MRLFILSILLLAALNTAVARQQDYPFKLKAAIVSGKQQVLAQNNGPAPIWVTVNLLNPVNATIDPQSPIALLVPPCETVTVATVHIIEPGKQYRITTNFKFTIGKPDAVQQPDAIYQLPFQEGQTITVGQAPGGNITTHNSPSSKYAIDFSVPVGTPIVAARKGRVVDIDNDYSEGGADPLLKANHVLILHEDGTLGLYSHLAKGTIPLAFGQWLEAGELIGYSGNTGYSTGPHLHFVVLSNIQTPDGTAQYLSLPAKFTNDVQGHEQKLYQGKKLMIKRRQVSLPDDEKKLPYKCTLFMQ